MPRSLLSDPTTRGAEPLPFDRIITVINERLDRHEQRLDRKHSLRLAVCEQLTGIRASLPMQRRPLSQRVQHIDIKVLNAKRSGLCPCCKETRVSTEAGRLRGAEYDHWFARNRAGAEETWLLFGLQYPVERIQGIRAQPIRKLPVRIRAGAAGATDGSDGDSAERSVVVRHGVTLGCTEATVHLE